MSDTPSILSLPEFRSISGLSDAEVVQLLSRGELPCSVAEDGSIQVDVASLTPEWLATRKGHRSESATTVSPQVEEAVASEILYALDDILEEALSMAMKWMADETRPENPSEIANTKNDD